MVTIILACYNQANFLADCIQSIQNQSFSDWECILVNDGSTDDTQKVLKSFCEEDARFQYIYQENQGVAVARNTGLQLARGEFIQFLDGDDMLQSSKLESQVAFLSHHTSVDIVYGSSRYFYEDMNELFPIHYLGFSPTFEMHYTDLNQQEVLLKTNVCTNCAALYRSTILSKGILFKSVQFEDWLFNIHCSFEGLIFHYAFHDNSFSLIRMNPNSLMLKHLSSLSNNLFDRERNKIISNYNFKSKLNSYASVAKPTFFNWNKLLSVNFYFSLFKKILP